MSDMPTIEKKSLLARFDEKHIIRVATSPDDPERLFVSLPDENGDLFTRSLSLNGGYNYPKLHVKVINNTASAVTFDKLRTLTDHGVLSLTVVVAANDTDEFDVIYMQELTNNIYNGMYMANLHNDGVNVVYDDTVNCFTGGGGFHPIDPSLDSYVTVNVRGV